MAIRRRVIGGSLLVTMTAAASANAAPPAAPLATAPSSSAAPAPTPSPAASGALKTEAERADALHRGVTLQGSDVGTELLTVVGQVVADRATEAGWAILRDRIEKDLACTEKTTPFPNVCVALQIRVQDLVASPRPLLDAAILDLLAILRDALNAPNPAKGNPVTTTAAVIPAAHADEAKRDDVSLNRLLLDLMGEWRNHTSTGGARGAQRVLRRAALDIGRSTSCPSGEGALARAEQAIWMVADCIVKFDGKIRDVEDRCDLDEELRACASLAASTSDGARAQVRREANEAFEAVVAKVARERAKYAIEYFFDVARDETHEARKSADEEAKRIDLLLAAEGAMTGAIDEDWTKVSVNAVAALSAAERLTQRPLGGKAFFTLSAAIGQYAVTYADPASKDSEQAQKARRDVVEALARSMVNRSDRRGGVVFSLGGTFGLGAAYRRSFDGATSGGFGPFVLPLGVGMQTYPENPKSAFGLTMQLSALDIGQYVAWEAGKAEVGSPELRNAVSIGLSGGIWFGSREVPIWIGPYGGISPFVRKDGTPSAFIGGTLGAYVPLIDF